VISSVCQPDLETCARAAAGDKWFQLYCRGAGFEWVATMANRVREAGYRALVITVDSAYYGIRERQVLSRWSPPARRRRNAGGDEYLAALDWDTVDRIKAVAQIPVVLKGIQSGDDAAIALERGIDAIWISNHGGRQPDHALGSIEVLPDVVARVGGKIPIVVDGGFMRVTDVLKAIALGATAVATGRLQALALAAGAEEGCVRMLEILEDEITTAMALLGVTSLTKLDHSYLHHSALSSPAPAFPHLPPAMRP
jgi:isopentenyl diphosphate isomerase/L-lactate dehydrogenase-like FMN-dependent dehydrogenase